MLRVGRAAAIAAKENFAAALERRGHRRRDLAEQGEKVGVLGGLGESIARSREMLPGVIEVGGVHVSPRGERVAPVIQGVQIAAVALLSCLRQSKRIFKDNGRSA